MAGVPLVELAGKLNEMFKLQNLFSYFCDCMITDDYVLISKV